MTRQPTRRTVLTALTALAGAPLILGLTGCLPRSEAETDPVDGQVRIRLAMLQPPRSGLTPFSDDAFKLSRWSTAETLVVLDDQGDPLPGLAVSWERTDPRTWRFTLREGVLFHDGTRLDAEVVRTALQAGIDAAPKPRILDGVQLSVRAVDERTIEVASRDEDPLIPGRLSSPQLAILSPRAYDGPTVDPKGTGTGPFVLAEVNGTSSARLERFEDYWGPTAKAPGIDVSFVPDGTARGAALRTGEADLVEAIPVSQVQLLDQELIHEVPMPRTCTLYVNVTSPVLRDPGLRAAVREAVDRDALVRTVYEGHADAAEGLLGPALPWAASLRETPEANPATRPEGQELVLGTFTDRSELPEAAVALQQQLERAGFRVRQDVREYAHIEEDALAGAFDLFLLSRATVLDSGDPVAYLVSDFGSEGSFNLSQIADPTVDAALRAAAAAPLGERRRRAVMAAERAVLATDAAIPLLHERVIQGEAASLHRALRDPRERELVDEGTHHDA